MGYAFLAARPGLSSLIVAKGGWDATELRPSGEYATLTQCIEAAKSGLRAHGIRHGDLIVFLPGGEQCARTRIETFEASGDMTLFRAPVAVLSPNTIKRTSESIQSRSELARDTKSRSPSADE
jgi:hypothetical protein